MAWTNICTVEFYEEYIRQNEERFSAETIQSARKPLVQTILTVFSEEGESAA